MKLVQISTDAPMAGAAPDFIDRFVAASLWASDAELESRAFRLGRDRGMVCQFCDGPATVLGIFHGGLDDRRRVTCDVHVNEPWGDRER